MAPEEKSFMCYRCLTWQTFEELRPAIGKGIDPKTTQLKRCKKDNCKCRTFFTLP